MLTELCQEECCSTLWDRESSAPLELSHLPTQCWFFIPQPRAGTARLCLAPSHPEQATVGPSQDMGLYRGLSDSSGMVGRLTTRETTGDWMMRSVARVTTSSSLKHRDPGRSTMFPQLHIPQSSSIQIPPGLGNSHLAGVSPGSQHLLVHAGSSPHPQHPPMLPRTLLMCLDRRNQWEQEPSSGQGAGQRAVQGSLPPMSKSECLPGRGGLELQGEQGQQIQGGLAHCPLGHLCHGDLPREQESQGDSKAGREGTFLGPGGELHSSE